VLAQSPRSGSRESQPFDPDARAPATSTTPICRTPVVPVEPAARPEETEEAPQSKNIESWCRYYVRWLPSRVRTGNQRGTYVIDSTDTIIEHHANRRPSQLEMENQLAKILASAAFAGGSAPRAFCASWSRRPSKQSRQLKESVLAVAVLGRARASTRRSIPSPASRLGVSVPEWSCTTVRGKDEDVRNHPPQRHLPRPYSNTASGPPTGSLKPSTTDIPPSPWRGRLGRLAPGGDLLAPPSPQAANPAH